MKKTTFVLAALLTGSYLLAQDPNLEGQANFDMKDCSLEEVQVAQADFDTKYYSFALRIMPKDKDGDMAAFAKMDQALRDLIDQTRAPQKANLLQLFMTFLKELQEAVMAGFNLYMSAETQQESLGEVVEEMLIEEVLAPQDEQASVVVQENSESSAAVSKQVLSIIVSCACSQPEQAEQFEQLKSKLELFAADLNQQNIGDLVCVMAQIYEDISMMPDASISLLAQ